MKTFLRPTVLTLAAVLLWLLTATASASHFRFANLSWKRAPGTNALAVEITLTEAWQRFSKGTVGYSFGDGTGTFDSSTASLIATLADISGEQYEVWRYTTTHTYPSNGIFTISGSSCCRIESLVNASSASESLSMLVDLRGSSNTGSPVTTAPVILQMQAGTNNSIALPVVDPDGDAFTVRLSTSTESSIPSIPTVGTNTMSVTAGGVLNWNTVGGTNGQKFALQVLIEERRAGNTTGTNGLVPLDFIIELAGSLTNSTPTISGTNGSIIVAANQTFTTTFVGTDPEGGPLRINHQGLPPGATITPADGTTNSSPATVMFSWTPSLADVGSSYAVLIFFTDQGGLQRAASFALTVSAPPAVREFELLSINSGGTASGSAASLNPVVSSNGQYVAFVSDAANLVANDNNGARDVFWRDRLAGTTRLVSRTTAGASGNGDSDAPVISSNGRYVAFHSRASNLVATDSNTNYDVFVWDSNDNSMTLVSSAPSGASGAGDSYSPQLSASGRVVSFSSSAADLVGSDTNGTSDAFARNLDSGVTYLASINTNNSSGNGASGVPVLSADGRHVAFLSRAGDLVTNDLNSLNDVFVHDLQTRVTRLVSVNVAGNDGGNRLSSDPVISADGRYVAFSSQATNLVTITDTNDFPDVFVRDMQLGVTKLVSVNGSGTASGGNAGTPSILPASFTPFLSADGTKVLFVSLAQDLVANDSNGKQDVFLRDHINNTTLLISTNRFGTGSGNAASGIGANSMSADLRYVAFFSAASNIGAADTNSRTDVFLRDLATNSSKIISRVSLGGFAATGHSFQPVLSADGSTILFTSEAENLDTRDGNLSSDVFAAATTLGTPNFGVVDVGISISSVGAQTVGSNFTITLTLTNHSANLATGLVVDDAGVEFLQLLSGTVSQGTLTSDDWVVGDLAPNGSATATLTLVATNLGSADLVISISKRDQLDSNLNNNSALSTITVDRTAAGALFHLPGTTPYLSRTNSPFFAGILSGAFTLETFERGNSSIAGVTASAGRVAESGAFTDSVDADDGAVDGNGNAGRSYLVTETNTVTFTFNPLLLGRLPTKVGIVISDTFTANTRMEAFNAGGASLGIIGPLQIGDNLFTGQTAEDRFIGVEFAGGISALRVFYPQPDFELDHLQFDVPTTDLALSLTGPTMASFGSSIVLTYTVTNRGPVAASGVVVTNAEPGQVEIISFVPSQGTVDTNNGTWSLGALAVGASATLTLQLTPEGSGFLLFNAGVSSAVPDAHTGNDLASLGVTVLNLAPNISFATNTLALLEDSAALSVPAFLQVSPQETNQTITNVTVTASNPALFSVQPKFETNGTLNLTLAGDVNGSSVITVVATDDGGTASGGADRATNSFTITVTAVNDAPSFTTATNNVVVLEDAAAQTLPGFVTASVGPADEAGQGVTNYTVTSSLPGLFAVGPALALDGTLTFTPAANSNGMATITVIAQDIGGTANGGADRATNSFTITVSAVNDAPSFTMASNNVVVLEDAGLVTLAGFITSVSPGPADEAAQSVTNFVVVATNSAFFAVAPAIGTNGTLTFTAATNTSGVATVFVQAQDDGGTANGGTNGSLKQSFTITISDINDAPIITLTTNTVFGSEDSGAQTITAFATFLTIESGQAITNVSATNSNPALFAVQPYFTTDGTLRFTPAPNSTGTGIVTVVVQDNGGTASGGVDMATNTFTVIVSPVNTAPSFTLTAGTSRDGVQDWVRDVTTGTSTGLKVITDSSGNVIVAGDETISGEVTTYQVLLVKYSNAGVAQWTNFIAGNSLGSSVQARGLAVDSTGAVILTGVHSGGGTDFLTVKYADDGSLVWSNRFDALGNDEPMAVVVDGNNKVIVTGKSQDGFYTDYLTIKYLADGTPFWTNRASYSGPGNDVPRSVAVDAAGDVYVTGDGSDTDFIFAYTLKLAAATGVPLWTNQFDLGQNSTAEAVRVDSGGNVIVAGTLNNALSQPLFGVVKYSSAGAVVWTNLYSRNAEFQHVHGLAVDSAGNAVVTGNTEVSGNMDFTTIKYLSDGTPAWTNHYDGVAIGRDHPNAIAVNAAGDVIVTGDSAGTLSTDFVTVKYTAAGAGVWTNRYDGTSSGNDIPNAIAVDSGTNAFVTGAADGVMRTIKYAFVPPPGANQTVTNNVGAVTVSGFIASSSVGPANESGQSISFTVTNDNTALFTVQPSISAAGVLSYTVAAGVSGLAIVTVSANDSGGTANGGVDTSAPQTFNITVLTGGSSVFYVWLGGTGDWNDAAGWTPRGVPGVVDSAFMSSGSIQLTNTVTVAILTHDGGTLGGAGTVTIRSNMTWTGGVMSGAGTTTISGGATLTVSGAADKSLNRRLDNHGTVTWTEGRIIGDGGPTINNAIGALFDTQTDSTLFDSNDGSVKTFNNSGTVRKSVGTSTSLWRGVFNNSGTVNVQAGTLSPTGTVNLNTSSYTGAGRFLLGSCTVNGTLTVAAGANVELGGGTLSGTGTIAGTLNWTAGTMGAGGTTTIASNSVLMVSGGADKSLNRRLDNYGTVTWTTGRITGDSTPVLNNYAGALFDTQSDATLFDSNDSTVKTFNNSGTVRKSAGTGTSIWQGLFNNGGTLNVQTGTLALAGGGESSGAFTNALGATVDFTGGTQVLTNGASFSGAGLSRINGGTLNVSTNATVAFTGNFELALGTLGGAGTFSIPAGSQMAWTGGVMAGSGTTTIASNGVLVASASADKSLNRRLDNYGTVTWTGGRIIGDSSPVLNNFAGALFDTQTDSTLFESNDASVKTFNNSGTIRKSAGPGVSLWRGVFNNSGTVNVQTGTLNPTDTVNLITSSYSGAGRFLFGSCTVNGTLTVAAGANVEFGGGTLSGTATIVGTLNWTGGVMGAGGITTIAANGVLVASGGADKSLSRQLDNHGTVTWTAGRIIGDNAPVLNNFSGALLDAQTDSTLFESNDASVKTLNNSGTVRKSAGTGTSSWLGVFNNSGALEIQRGIVSLTGNYTPAAGSSLKVFLGGLAAGTQFGQLRVAGTATLTGTLNIVLTNSFVPALANSFLVVSSGVRSGTFSSVTGSDLGGGLILDPTYVLGDLTLVTTMVAALPPLMPQAIGADRLLRWPGDIAGYELQTATSINGPWTAVVAAVAQENGDSVVRLPATGTRFYRLVRPAAPRPGGNPAQ
ncbi:MAG: PD40 domain-containing protein [Verrucomicrobia bacterium]|nr:PD40 domain-containing protein [Verrucomicrobiota bacterium]